MSTARLPGVSAAPEILAINHLHSTRTDLDLSGKGAVKLNEGDAGQLTASVHGAGSLRAPSATAVRLSNSGSGSIVLKSVKGALDAELSGAGTLTVDAVEVSSANIQVTGHSNVKLGPGTIANLSMSSSGASDVEVNAVVTDLNVSAVGSGDIRFAKVTGRVSQSSTGSAKIVVGR